MKLNFQPGALCWSLQVHVCLTAMAFENGLHISTHRALIIASAYFHVGQNALLKTSGWVGRVNRLPPLTRQSDKPLVGDSVYT